MITVSKALWGGGFSAAASTLFSGRRENERDGRITATFMSEESSATESEADVGLLQLSSTCPLCPATTCPVSVFAELG